MIVHIVVFTTVGETPEERRSSAESLRDILQPLAGTIPGVVSLAVELEPHRVAGHADAVLVSRHATWEDLDAYQVHPDHVAAAAATGPYVVTRGIVDYETDREL